MWCTRWFLPLLLLPLPTAPPYFLLLFLLSLTIHAKPCFYCIVLLTTLFVTSCYWQPFPIDSPLTTPWSENITTFAEALNSTLPTNYSHPLPTVIRAVDRCWCEFSPGGFFQPFNVSNWEYLSVQRLSNEMSRQMTLEDNSKDNSTANIVDLEDTTEERDRHINDTISVPPPTLKSATSKFWWGLRSLSSKLAIPSSPDSTQQPTYELNNSEQTSPQNVDSSPAPSMETPIELPLRRREYDLRSYGFGMIIDLGWSR